jgi:hypothetical protein
MAADRVNRILMSTYGRQYLATRYEGSQPIRRLFLDAEFGPSHLAIIREGGLRYIVVDRRLANSLPMVGVYFDRGEQAVYGQHEVPLDPVLLSKFDRLTGVDRIFDSGNIQIYDVTELSGDN